MSIILQKKTKHNSTESLIHDHQFTYAQLSINNDFYKCEEEDGMSFNFYKIIQPKTAIFVKHAQQNIHIHILMLSNMQTLYYVKPKLKCKLFISMNPMQMNTMNS